MLTNFKTYQLAVELYNTCDGIKARAYIKDQLMRASLSIVLNLAEGSAKPQDKERRRFYAIALGSLRETQALLSLLKQERAFAQANTVGGYVFRLVYPRNPVP